MVSDLIAELAFTWIMGLAHGDEQAQKVAKFWTDAFHRDRRAAALAWTIKVMAKNKK